MGEQTRYGDRRGFAYTFSDMCNIQCEYMCVNSISYISLDIYPYKLPKIELDQLNQSKSIHPFLYQKGGINLTNKTRNQILLM